MYPRKLLICLSILFFSRYALAVNIGQDAPKCSLFSLADKQNQNLEQFQGKVVYVDFWASWCGPCAKSFPFLNEMHRQLKDKGLEIVGINLDENLEDAKGFLAKYPAKFTVLADTSQEKKCAKDFEVKAMPSSYIIDAKGKVHHVQLGFKAGESQELQTMVEKLLN